MDHHALFLPPFLLTPSGKILVIRMKETRNNEFFVSSWAIEIDLHSLPVFV